MKTWTAIAFCTWITTVLNCLQGAATTATWIIEPSITNGFSSIGQTTHLDTVNLGQCVVECSVETSCVTVGYTSSTKKCQLYNLDLEDHQSLTMMPNTFFYKSVCDNNEYTHIRRLNTCIKQNATHVTFEEARADCQADGADLLMVKSSAVLTYLRDIMISVIDVNKYWLGATRDPVNASLWWWVDGTRMTSETGWDFWAENEPSGYQSSKCLRLDAVGGEVYFNDKACTRSHPFWCEMRL